MSANAHAVRSSPFSRSALIAFFIVAFVVIVSILSPLSARADEVPPSDETTSSDVAPVEEAVSLVVPDPAPVVAPAPEPAPQPAPEPVVVAPAPPAAPAVEEAPVTPAVNEAEEVTEAPITDAEETSEVEDAAKTPDSVSAAEVAPVPSADELPPLPNAETGVAPDGKHLYLKALSGDFTDWTLVIRDSNLNPIVQGFALTLGGEYTFPITKTGLYQMALEHPTRDSIGAGEFYVYINPVPFGQPYVNVSNESVVSSVLAATVSFNYAVVDGVDETTVGIRIYPVGSDDPAGFLNLQLSGSGTVSESFELPAGDYIVQIYGDHNFGVDVFGWDTLTEDLPLTVKDEEEPGVIVPQKPTVDGNTVTIPTQDDVEYFDVETGEVVTGEVTIPEVGICIGARTYVSGSDGYLTWIEVKDLGKWCFEYLPENTWLKASSFTYDCEAGVVVHHFSKTPVTYTRDADDKVVMTLGETVVKNTEYPMTDEELAACEPVVPVDPTNPVDPTSPTTPVNPGGGTTIPVTTPVNSGGSKGTATVKADSLAMTGGESAMGTFALGGLLVALSLPLVLRRRRANKA